MTVESRIDVRYPDADPMDIVHHAVYPLWYEIGRMDFFKACGYPYTYTHEFGVNPAMVNMELKYHFPVRYPGTVTLRTRVTRCEPKKVEFRYAVYIDGRDEPVAEAVSFHIWTGPDMKSYNMEENLPECYAAYKAACEG